MKILHVTYSDTNGGAARAAYRLHKAQRKIGLDSYMLVVDKSTDDEFVYSIGRLKGLLSRLYNFLSHKILSLQEKEHDSNFHSINLFSSGVVPIINSIEPDIVNLHWLGREMMSIRDISKIQQKTVWTLHDMWAFCGCEHYVNDDVDARFIKGYDESNRLIASSGLDIDRYTYRLKCRLWAEFSMSLISPSRWLLRNVQDSRLFENRKSINIQNCIDHDVFKPMSSDFCREVYNLPKDKRLLLFGAMSSTSDPRKGYQMLKPALERLKLSDKSSNFELVVFGASKGNAEEDIGIVTHYVGELKDDIGLSILYNVADIFIAPSLQDNLPNTLVEALACGCPCVAFDIGGMRDLISDVGLGELSTEVTAEGLALAIERACAKSYDPDYISNISRMVRGEDVIAKQYADFYNKC